MFFLPAKPLPQRRARRALSVHTASAFFFKRRALFPFTPGCHFFHARMEKRLAW